jgi:hypothetical protein
MEKNFLIHLNYLDHLDHLVAVLHFLDAKVRLHQQDRVGQNQDEIVQGVHPTWADELMVDALPDVMDVVQVDVELLRLR